MSRIDREYGLGRGRIDLYVAWPVSPGIWQRVVIEMKIIRGSRDKTIQAGLAQIYRYADQCGADEAHLLVFDQRPRLSWDEKIFRENRVYEDGTDGQVRIPVTVWGMLTVQIPGEERVKKPFIPPDCRLARVFPGDRILQGRREGKNPCAS